MGGWSTSSSVPRDITRKRCDEMTVSFSDLRSKAGGFSRMVREDAEDYLGQSVGIIPEKQDSRFFFILLADTCDQRMEHLIDFLEEETSHKIQDMGLRVPARSWLLQQLDSSKEMVDFVWCCGLPAEQEHIPELSLIEFSREMFTAVTGPCRAAEIDICAAAGLSISEAYGTLANAVSASYKIDFGERLLRKSTSGNVLFGELI